MPRVLGRPNSFNVRKVLWLCAEPDLPYTREDYGRDFNPTSTPGCLALNPVAQVPVVIDGKFVMRESNAIPRYLAAKQGAEALYPGFPVVAAYYEKLIERPGFRAHGRNGMP